MKKLTNLAAGVVLAGGLAIPGMAQAHAVMPTWLHPGSSTQHPSSGGTWEYGFWNVKVRSYYTVGGCHGSSVTYNGGTVRSANTASGQKSSAEKYAVNTPGADDKYYYRTC